MKHNRDLAARETDKPKFNLDLAARESDNPK